LCQRTFLFAGDIVDLCVVLSKDPGVKRLIAGQLLRAGTSVGSNTEEARSAYSRREFACKNSTVLKEAREARYWLRLLTAKKLAPHSLLDPLLAEAEELVGVFTATVRKAKLPLAAKLVIVGFLLLLPLSFFL
jgi:four helix bundle protein